MMGTHVSSLPECFMRMVRSRLTCERDLSVDRFGRMSTSLKSSFTSSWIFAIVGGSSRFGWTCQAIKVGRGQHAAIHCATARRYEQWHMQRHQTRTTSHSLRDASIRTRRATFGLQLVDSPRPYKVSCQSEKCAIRVRCGKMGQLDVGTESHRKSPETFDNSLYLFSSVVRSI